MIKRRIFLKKQDLKFSAAHFTILSPEAAEKLHGHNYHVSVVLEWIVDSDSPIWVDFGILKQDLRRFLSQLDEKVLLPTNREMVISQDQNTLTVLFRDRRYQFPSSEVQVLPITNISVEDLAEYIGKNLLQHWLKWNPSKLIVGVEETIGQGAEWIWIKDN